MTPIRLLMFAEHASDFRRAAILVDRVLADRVAWLADLLAVTEHAPSDETRQLRRTQRCWVDEQGNDGQDEDAPYADVHRLDRITKALQREQGFGVARGRFEGQPGEHASKLGRKALSIARQFHRQQPLGAVVLLVDMDGDTSRKDGLNQARSEAEKQDQFAIVLGCPNESIEAWLLAAFEPQSQREQAVIKTVQQTRNLGFHSCEEAHLLSHKENVPKSSKGVLDEVTGGDHGRQEEGLRTTPMERLSKHGQHSGLSDFLGEVAQRIAPLFTAS